MSPFKRFRRASRPRTFAFQLLVAMLACSAVPLLILSVMAGQTVKTQLQHSSAISAKLTERNYIRMYQDNIEEQVQAIDTELRKVEDAVLVTKAMAESIFSVRNDDSAAPAVFTYDRQTERYVEPQPDGKGLIAVRADAEDPPPTAEQARDFGKSRALQPIFRSETARKPNIVSMYYIHPQSGSFHYPKYEGPPDQYPRKINKLTTYPFYTDALEIPPDTARVVWTKPYWDITPRGWMFTATAPVYDENDTLKGVVAADVTIDSFVGNVLDTSFDGQDGYALLLDTDFQLIAAQKRGLGEINQLNLSAVFRTEASASTESYRRLQLNGENKAVFSRTIPSTEWTLGYVVSERKLLEPVHAATRELDKQTERKLTAQLALLCALAGCLCVLLAFYLRSRVARPVNLLADAFAGMGEGQFASKLSDTRTLEFNRLLHSFNRMSRKIGELVEQQALLNQQLESKVQLRTNELREINEELKLRVEELMRVEEWRKGLFMNISHDLKTPITLIQGYIEAIHDGTIPADQTGLFLERIHEGVGTITRFVRSLNELSLLETGQLKAEMTRLEGDAFFRAAAEKWAPFMALEERPFAAEQEAEGGTLWGDAHLLERVIDNLIENAVKYTEAGSPIVLRYELDGGSALFRVVDAGAGIPEEELAHVFDSFYRVDKSRNSGIPGSGLGLSIAREIAVRHGGDLTVRLNERQGCTFTLSLPLRADADAPRAEAG